MDDTQLLRELAQLFYVDPEGSATWMWEPSLPVANAASPEVQAALLAYRTREGISNLV